MPHNDVVRYINQLGHHGGNFSARVERFGANDLDGTVAEEKIYHDAGAKTSQFTPHAELERLIRAAGRIPVERDTQYRPVDRSKMPPIQPTPRPDLVSLTLNV